MLNIERLADLEARVGQELFTSNWLEVSQERINLFAEATGDHQWIHVDIERAEREAVNGTTIAHGYLTLSLIPALLGSGITIADARSGINYGLNRVRFPTSVPAGSRIRGCFTLQSYTPVTNGAQLVFSVTVELEGSAKPCCVAETVSIRYL